MAIREDMLATRMGPNGLNLLQQDWSNLKICFQKVNSNFQKFFYQS